jgi:hypothetical protein
MVGVSHEPASAVVPPGPPLLVGAFAALEFSAARPEAAPGAVDCDSLFRHTFILHQI